MTALQKARPLLPGTCAFLAGLLVLYVAGQSLMPRFTNGTLRDAAGKSTEFLLPLRAPTEGPTIDVELEALLGRIHPALYHFDIRGCVEHFSLNGTAVTEPGFPFCASEGRVGPKPETFDLSSYLRPGRNVFELRVRRGLVAGKWTIHTLNIGASTNDPLVLALTTLLALLIGGYGILLAHHLPTVRKEVFFILAGGAILRAIYVIGTNVSTRAYDWHGHLVYVSYFAEHLSIPSAQTSWQAYQPPLYYALCGVWVRLGSALGRPIEALFQDVQLFSGLLSAGALAAGVWIGTMLFPSLKQRRDLLLFGAMLAAFPGLVFFSSRISNDGPYHFLAFLFLGLMLRFWQRGRELDWWLLSVVVGLALLTKSSALLFLPIACVCLLLKEGVAPRRKAALLSLSLSLVVLIAGWLYVLRFVVEGEQSLVGNMHRFGSWIRLENSLADFLVFNPLAVIEHPFVDDRVAETRPAMFWEYLFRTAHFGGFRLREGPITHIAVAMLASSILLLPVVALGCLREARLRSPTLPLAVTTLTLLAAQIGYRVRYPFSFNQDFRFSVLLFVPLTYYAVAGRQLLPERLQGAATLTMATFIALSTASVVALYLVS